MALVRHDTNGGTHTSSTFNVTKTGPMELTVSAGTWTEPDETTGDPVTMTLAAPEVLGFTASATDAKDVLVCLIHDPDGSPATDVWVDEIPIDAPLIKDATTTHADPPAGYRVVSYLAWFEIPANETDLDNTTVNWMGVN